MIFNPVTDYKGRVVNIKDSFGNLPHNICFSMQYMNESVTMKDQGLLTGRTVVESLNHTMLLAYKVSITVSLLYTLSLILTNFIFIFVVLAATNQTYIITYGLVRNVRCMKASSSELLRNLRKKLDEEAKVASEDKASLESEIAKVKAQNVELQTQLQGSQECHSKW